MNKKFLKKIDVGPRQHLFVTFKLKNVASGKPVSTHQAFLKFTQQKTKKITYFVIPYSSSQYELRVDITQNSKKFNYVSGTYSVELLVGDSYIDKSIRSVIAEVEIKFDGESKPDPLSPFEPLPVIEHIFRAKNIEASESMANIFTILVILPLGFLVIGSLRAGANFNNYPTSGLTPIFTFIFIGGLELMLSLIVIYWFYLKLFTALTYLTIIGIPTVFFGNQVLRYYAEQRLKSSKKHKD